MQPQHRTVTGAITEKPPSVALTRSRWRDAARIRPGLDDFGKGPAGLLVFQVPSPATVLLQPGNVGSRLPAKDRSAAPINLFLEGAVFELNLLRFELADCSPAWRRKRAICQHLREWAKRLLLEEISPLGKLDPVLPAAAPPHSIGALAGVDTGSRGWSAAAHWLATGFRA